MARQLKNWLDSYMVYLTDAQAPMRFKYWSGISCISAAMKRNLTIQHGTYVIYPNMYVILTGPPGVGKNEVIDPVKKLLTNSDTANLIKDSVTAPKVVDKLDKGFPVTRVVSTPSITPGGQSTTSTTIGTDKTALIVAPELPIYLNSSPWTLEFMCEMWNSNAWNYETKTKGSAILTDINVGLLGGCVPDYIRKLHRESSTDTVTGGFSSRCLFVYGDKPSKYVAYPIDSNSQLEAQLVSDLQEIAMVTGDVAFSSGARNYFNNYYQNIERSDFDSEVIKGFKARIKVHIFKIAMVLTLADRDWEHLQTINFCSKHNPKARLFILEDKLRKAVSLVETIMQDLDTVFGGVGESKLVNIQNKVINYLQMKGRATFGQILTKVRKDIDGVDDLNRILWILQSTDPKYITVDTSGSPPRDWYVFNKALLTRQKGFGATP